MTSTSSSTTPSGRVVLTPSDAVAARVAEARKRRGWSGGQLAAQCAKAGVSHLTKAVLANIESGRPDSEGRRRREVSVDELLALASVLDVAPLYLMGFPQDREDDTVVMVSPTRAVDDPDQLMLWIRGDKPLPGTDSRLYFTTALEHMPTLDSERVLDELRRAVLQDRAKDLVGQFRGETGRAISQAQEQVQQLIADAGAALATGASVEEMLVLLRDASDRLKTNDAPAAITEP